MTLDEFKAFRDGYTQAKRGKLTDKDYALILAKLDEVQPHFCGCHWHSYTTPNFIGTYGAPVDITPTITWANVTSSNVKAEVTEMRRGMERRGRNIDIYANLKAD